MLRLRASVRTDGRASVSGTYRERIDERIAKHGARDTHPRPIIGDVVEPRRVPA
jgi:hypothetical protein